MKYSATRITYRHKWLIPVFLTLILFLNQPPTRAQVVDTDEKARLQQFEDAITRGEQFLSTKEYAKAKAEYQKALSIDPTAKYPKDKLTYIRKFYVDPADEARFSQAMDNGNKLMGSADYAAARIQFDLAVNIKPEDKNARDKLSEADKMNLAKQEAIKQYNKLIAEADKLFTAKDYVNARPVYDAALKADPAATYPRQRISDIDARMSADKAQKDSYEKALSEGDEAYMNRDFAMAKLKYEMALKIKPGENYPKSMLERVSQGSAQLKDAQQNYQVAVAGADKLFNTKDYLTALTAYENALKILPGEIYPSQQIEKINAILLQKQQLEDDYVKAVSAGDAYFTEKKYAEAKAEFQNANNLKPGEAYPKQKIEEIAGLQLAIKEAERVKAYNKVVSEADLLFDSGSYNEALVKYQEATGIKSEESYPKERIAAINKLTSDARAAQVAYEKAIAEADRKFASASFDESIALYQTAIGLKPQEAYPTLQISKARESIEALRIKEESYNQAIALADKLKNSEDFEGALAGYRQALAIKPNSTYPQEQIAGINTILAANKSKEEQFQSLIAEADKLYKAGSYTESLDAYKKSLLIKPQEKYPADQIAAISALIEAQKAQKTAYDQCIADADRLFGEADYDRAGKKYAEALTILPAEKYPGEKIEAIASILEQRKSLEENFAKNLKEGDNFFNTNDFENAIKSYRNAQALKPAEKYPQEQIILAERKLAEMKSLNENYINTIAQADLKFNTGEFTGAIALYVAAQSLKPSEEYPAQQIEKARETLNALQQKEDAYKKALASGDQSYQSGNLEAALNSYQQALSIKPDETYPGDQIGKINASLAANRSMEDQYQKLIGDADRFFDAGLLAESSKNYTQALSLKPGEKYPQEQLKAIVAQEEAQKAKLSAYNQQISAADKLYNEGSFEKALIKFKEAALTLPEEKYPQEKIASISTLIEQLKSLEENYAKNIAEGDLALKANNPEKAMLFFEQAKALKPSERYPQDKLAQISKILGEQKILNDNYQRVIAEADRLFNSGELDAAAVKYKEGHDLKPAEVYPQEQIGIINNMISKQKESKEAYRLLIAEADQLYNRNETDKATIKYQEALTLKPSETYPAEQIAKINKLKTEMMLVEQAYAEQIMRGDTLYSSGAFDEAILAYRQAQGMKPKESYPADRIAMIEKEISERRSLNENYMAYINEADRLYTARDYTSALDSYKRALALKKTEVHPQERIREIEAKLEEQKQLANKDYDDAIETANRLFNLQDFTSAIKSYEKASAIKPAESYPKNKLIEINTILMERVRNQMDAYNKVINKADLAYQDKVFDQAIDAYEEAKLIRPEEAYPAEMIRKIRQYMEDHAMVDLVSTPLIIKADSEQKFQFKAIEMRLRKNNYIIIKARKTGETEPKVYLNYGIDGQKSGGIVLRSIKSQETGDYMVRVSIQDRWYRLDNNWISVYSEGGEVEVSRMQISQGD
ncbi:MAG: hypothetical protein FD166_2328 [Bacteroidetes bacterium]|nr:MAG: hypothetical protein FD166_2328 [Bacteroidota bacterium]